MKVYIVIPAYNESATVGSIVKKSKKFGNVIVVDDCSKDDTYHIAKKSGAIVIRHKVNMGYGKALKDGMNEALRRCAECIITIDADGQHDPDDIPRLIKEIENGYDIVAGSRFLGGKQWSSWRRMYAIRLLALQARIMSGVRLTDIQSGFRAYRSHVLKSIKIEDYGMGFSVEVPIKAKKRGYRFTEVPIRIEKPHAIKNLYTVLRQGIGVGIAIIKYSLLR